ncbi:hypothetical protein HMPREF9374_1096 [Desmospora sp. 8437]|nr:hypothetical protein HMPREF9374_1096 [Desmospora sp. 8437]
MVALAAHDSLSPPIFWLINSPDGFYQPPMLQGSSMGKVVSAVVAVTGQHRW